MHSNGSTPATATPVRATWGRATSQATTESETTTHGNLQSYPRGTTNVNRSRQMAGRLVRWETVSPKPVSVKDQRPSERQDRQVTAGGRTSRDRASDGHASVTASSRSWLQIRTEGCRRDGDTADMKALDQFRAGRLFPAGFIWGAATSSYQIEGAADRRRARPQHLGPVLRDARDASPTARTARWRAITTTGGRRTST